MRSSARALAERGLEYLNTEHPTGTLFPDGTSAFLTTNTDGNAAELDRHAAGDGERWRETIAAVAAQAELVFGVLGTELWSSRRPEPRRQGLPATRTPTVSRSSAPRSCRAAGTG